MAATLKLDWTELLWYLQGGVCGSHLRWGIYEDFVNKVWPQLNENELENIYTYAKRDLSGHFHGEYNNTPHEYFLQLLARFNPANQYKVTLRDCQDGKATKKVEDAYLWDGKYYVDWRRYCASEFIVKVERKNYHKCTNRFCNARNVCLRNIEHKVGDPLFRDNCDFACDKCDFLIEKEEDRTA